jgi:hypothetical protein
MRCYKLILVGFLLGATSCAQFGAYMENRALDLADSFLVRVGAGPGMLVSVQVFRVGPSFIFGFGSLDNRVGYIGREYVISGEGIFGIGIVGARIYFGGEGGKDYFASFGHSSCSEVAAELLFISDTVYRLLGIFPGRDGDILKGGPTAGAIKHLFWIEVDIYFFGDLNVGFNPYEFMDFLLGFFGIDESRDDVWRG